MPIAGRKVGPVVAVLLAVAALTLLGGAALWFGASLEQLPSATVPPSSPVASASPDDGASTSPYVLVELAPDGSPQPKITIRMAADCVPLATDWLRSFCALTVRPRWQLIVGPMDPLRPRVSPSAVPGDSVTWFASLARATIDGDTSICDDVAMREWMLLGSSGGGAPPPGTTFAPIRPVAACLSFLRATATAGTFAITDQAGQWSVRLSTSAGAVVRAAQGIAPAFDPGVVCDATTRDVCGQLIAAVTTFLGQHASTIQTLRAQVGLIACPDGQPPCSAPTDGVWLGSVLAATDAGATRAFVVALVAGHAAVTEVPFTP